MNVHSAVRSLDQQQLRCDQAAYPTAQWCHRSPRRQSLAGGRVRRLAGVGMGLAGVVVAEYDRAVAGNVGRAW